MIRSVYSHQLTKFSVSDGEQNGSMMPYFSYGCGNRQNSSEFLTSIPSILQMGTLRLGADLPMITL